MTFQLTVLLTTILVADIKLARESEAHCADTVYLLGYVLYVNHLQADLINCTSYIFRIT